MLLACHECETTPIVPEQARGDDGWRSPLAFGSTIAVALFTVPQNTQISV